MPYRNRILVLPISALVIGMLVAYKLSQSNLSQRRAVEPSQFRRSVPHPPFQALDSYNRLVKLQAFLGRHAIVLVFFDGQTGAAGDRVLQQIRQNFDRFRDSRTIVLGISAALPQDNRKVFETDGEFPFRLLSDPAFVIQRQWGVFDEQTKTVHPAVFLIDRAGRVDWSGTRPQPLPPAGDAVDQVFSAIAQR